MSEITVCRNGDEPPNGWAHMNMVKLPGGKFVVFVPPGLLRVEELPDGGHVFLVEGKRPVVIGQDGSVKETGTA